MGIPSYYKKLCDSIRGLILKKRPDCNYLLLDFNCLIYHCIRRPGMRAYPGHSGREAWERDLIKEVCAYTQAVVDYVEPRCGVFLAVDGVVPMAKIKQQRLRRFKSVWNAAMEKELGKPEAEAWDTNAITPGTAFMELLEEELGRLCARKNGGGDGKTNWSMSGVSECGEGEQKIMRYLRRISDVDHVCIYGLDADLIILSLLATMRMRDDASIYLFREVVEMGTVQYNAFQEEKYNYLCIQTLKHELVGIDGGGNDGGVSGNAGKGNAGKGSSKYTVNERLYDYCMAMSLLGNDFLPHSLTFKLKGDGHKELLCMLNHIWKTGLLMKNETWNMDILRECFHYLAKKEEEWMMHTILTKYYRSKKPYVVRKQYDQQWIYDVEKWNNSPTYMCDELMLVDGKERRLRDDWREVYGAEYLGLRSGSSGSGSGNDSSNITHTYIQGLHWIAHYYNNTEPICWEWHYPWHVPPCWSDLATTELHHVNWTASAALKPQEQLALVLPRESWVLLRDKELRRIINLAPHYWPTQFRLFTAGRNMIWECPALIPTITPSYLRYMRLLLRK